MSKEALLRELRENLTLLKFSRHLEDLFRKYYFRRKIWQVRIAILAGIILYASFGVLDALISPNNKEVLWAIRYGVICPAGIIFLLSTFRLKDKDETALQWIHTLAVVVAGFGLLGMMMVVPQDKAYLYYAGVMLIIFYTYTLSAMRFYNALVGGVFLSVVLPFLGFYVFNLDTPYRFHILYYLASTNIIGVPVSYMLERHIRKDFIMALLLMREMNETAKLNRILKNMSYSDPLTGLYNRRKFEEFFEREWERARRYSRPISVIMVDIDFFKLYNDSAGHAEGDMCIKRIAGVLRKNIREGIDLPVRYGGEEFLIVLPETDIKAAFEVGERIRRDVESLKIPHPSPEVNGYVTVSVGVASCIPSEGDKKTLLNGADEALYRAKRGGKNRVETRDLSEDLISEVS
ncbi:MAG: diguanylate cyclase [Aquificae bacterium]|nr:diguanylate cyclase [Aquificota bacterium]